MKLCALFVLVVVGFNSLAQNGSAYIVGSNDKLTLPRNTHLFVIPPGKYWYQQPWKDSIYLLPEFLPGKLEFSNGFVPSNQPVLNYNAFLEIFEFKESDGETVPLDKNNLVKYIQVGDHKFIYSRSFGYLEVIAEGKASIAESTFMNATMEINSGVKYGNTIVDIRTNTAKTARYYWMEKRYFIFSDPSNIHRANPTALPKIFPKEKSKIKSFVKNHKTDFKKKEDLLEIVNYCNREL